MIENRVMALIRPPKNSLYGFCKDHGYFDVKQNQIMIFPANGRELARGENLAFLHDQKCFWIIKCYACEGLYTKTKDGRCFGYFVDVVQNEGASKSVREDQGDPHNPD